MTQYREPGTRANEIKFVVDSALATAVREWARRHLDPDPHGGGRHGDEYRTATVYLDSPAFDVLHRRGSFGRAKYRIRRYGDSPTAFLERKLRRPGLLIKRRTVVPLGDLPLLAGPSDALPASARWFRDRLDARGLGPVCHLAYLRTARQRHTGSGTARLTLDSDLLVGACSGLGVPGSVAMQPFTSMQILELKYQTFLPAVFKELLETFGLDPRTASKYRLGMASLLGTPVVDVALAPPSAMDAHV